MLKDGREATGIGRKEAELFKVLSVESRIRIVELLKQKGRLGVNEMAKALGSTPSAVSQHLKVLRYAGLVRNQRKGYWLPYEIDHGALARCGAAIVEVCRCGCTSTCRAQEPKPGESVDSLAYLRRRERELRGELGRIRDRIREAKGGG